MLRKTIQKMTKERQEVCRNIFKVCHDIKFKDSIAKQEGYVATEKFYVATTTKKC